MNRNRAKIFVTRLAALAFLALAAGCDLQDMYRQPKRDPLMPSDFFPDERSARPVVPDTVARGNLRTNAVYFTGKIGTNEVEQIPLPVTKDVLLRGQERFDIFCAPCHDRVGNGNGVIVQRGFRAPPSFHSEKLRAVPVGHFFDVASNGFGAMPDYASQIPVADRWAIAAYIRALQFSQYAPVAVVPEADRAKLKRKETAP